MGILYSWLGGTDKVHEAVYPANDPKACKQALDNLRSRYDHSCLVKSPLEDAVTQGNQKNVHYLITNPHTKHLLERLSGEDRQRAYQLDMQYYVEKLTKYVANKQYKKITEELLKSAFGNNPIKCLDIENFPINHGAFLEAMQNKSCDCTIFPISLLKKYRSCEDAQSFCEILIFGRICNLPKGKYQRLLNGIQAIDLANTYGEYRNFPLFSKNNDCTMQDFFYHMRPGVEVVLAQQEDPLKGLQEQQAFWKEMFADKQSDTWYKYRAHGASDLLENLARQNTPATQSVEEFIIFGEQVNLEREEFLVIRTICMKNGRQQTTIPIIEDYQFLNIALWCSGSELLRQYIFASKTPAVKLAELQKILISSDRFTYGLARGEIDVKEVLKVISDPQIVELIIFGDEIGLSPAEAEEIRQAILQTVHGPKTIPVINDHRFMHDMIESVDDVMIILLKTAHLHNKTLDLKSYVCTENSLQHYLGCSKYLEKPEAQILGECLIFGKPVNMERAEFLNVHELLIKDDGTSRELSRYHTFPLIDCEDAIFACLRCIENNGCAILIKYACKDIDHDAVKPRLAKIYKSRLFQTQLATYFQHFLKQQNYSLLSAMIEAAVKVNASKPIYIKSENPNYNPLQDLIFSLRSTAPSADFKTLFFTLGKYCENVKWLETCSQWVNTPSNVQGFIRHTIDDMSHQDLYQQLQAEFESPSYVLMPKKTGQSYHKTQRYDHVVEHAVFGRHQLDLLAYKFATHFDADAFVSFARRFNETAIRKYKVWEGDGTPKQEDIEPKAFQVNEDIIHDPLMPDQARQSSNAINPGDPSVTMLYLKKMLIATKAVPNIAQIFEREIFPVLCENALIYGDALKGALYKTLLRDAEANDFTIPDSIADSTETTVISLLQQNKPYAAGKYFESLKHAEQRHICQTLKTLENVSSDFLKWAERKILE